MKKATSWKELSLREKIGQTVICLCEPAKQIELCGSIEKFLEKYPVGGLFNTGDDVVGLDVGVNTSFKSIADEFDAHLRTPIFRVADRGSFASHLGFTLPPQMAYGAADDESLSYKAGEYMAEDYRKTSISWGLWPVCDLNMSSVSPVTDTRSVSDNWELTTKLIKQNLAGMRDHGIIATLKHYPGPAYNESIDPHLAPCDNETPIELWRSTYGRMYKELIEAGVPAIMTAHINLVDYQTEKIDGVYPPATMSYELTTKLLREELGFKGVTITDALTMGGFSGTKAIDNTVLSFLSGNDVLLWPAYEYIDEMEKRILSGEIDEKLLDNAVERIWNLKKEYGIIDGLANSFDADESYFKSKTKDIYEKCLTLVNNQRGLIPFNNQNTKKILVVCVTPDDEQYTDMLALKPAFEAYGCDVTIRRNIWLGDAQRAGNEYDLIIYALTRTTHRPVGPLDFWGDEAKSIWASNCSDGNKTVVVSFGTPYVYKYYRNSKMTYINAYCATKETFNALAKAIFGEIEFNGKSSVQL